MWVAYITTVWTAEGWLYLAVVLDVYSRFVVGRAVVEHHDEHLVAAALRMVLGWHEPVDDILHHSDRGSHYTSQGYQELLAKRDFQVNMSSKGNCYDDAMMKSFFSPLKTECLNRHLYQRRAQAKQSIFEWIGVFCDRQR